MRRIVSIVVALVLTIGGAMTMIYLLLFAHGWKGVILVAAGFVTTMGAVWAWRLQLLGQIVARGVARRELPSTVDVEHLWELIDGPLLHRIAVTGREMPPVFADRVVEDVMAVVHAP